VQTAANGGSKLLIFVRRAGHSNDLSLSFVAGRRASLPNRRLQDGGVLDLRATEHRDWVEANAATSPGFVARLLPIGSCPFCGRTGQRSKEHVWPRVAAKVPGSQRAHERLQG
jgi:hypothetical protein